MAQTFIYRGVQCGLSILLSFWVAQAQAHLVSTGQTDNFNIWDFDPLALVILIALAAVYFRGNRILSNRNLNNRPQFNTRTYQFWLGWLTLILALVSPLDSLGEYLFSAHMIQRELLMLVAGPLLVMSRPGSAMVHGSKSISIAILRRLAGKRSNVLRLGHGLLSPLSAWIIHFIGLWLWHLPALFNASLTNNWLHSLQHICFLAISLIFWYSIFRTSEEKSMQSVVSLFTTAIHASILGALLTFSPVIWYQEYESRTQAWGLTPLQDQQLGGLIMWMPAGVVFVAIALVQLAQYLQKSHDVDATDKLAPIGARSSSTQCDPK